MPSGHHHGRDVVERLRTFDLGADRSQHVRDVALGELTRDGDAMLFFVPLQKERAKSREAGEEIGGADASGIQGRVQDAAGLRRDNVVAAGAQKPGSPVIVDAKACPFSVAVDTGRPEDLRRRPNNRPADALHGTDDRLGLPGQLVFVGRTPESAPATFVRDRARGLDGRFAPPRTRDLQTNVALLGADDAPFDPVAREACVCKHRHAGRLASAKRIAAGSDGLDVDGERGAHLQWVRTHDLAHSLAPGSAA